MFFHGIPFIYLVRQYPVLNPASSFRNKSPAKRADARRLIRTIGFEPVHLLRSSPSYPIRRCLEACFRYGEVVFARMGRTHSRLAQGRLGYHQRQEAPLLVPVPVSAPAGGLLVTAGDS
jgi:hypothetical protein